MRKIRLGRIRYINVLPIYYALEKGIIQHDFKIIYGTPSELNKMASERSVDISSVSSIEYARNFSKYFLVPDISIGSNGSVKSVLLKSKVPFHNLHKKDILVSAQTHTSFALLKMILTKKFKVLPRYKVGSIEDLLDKEKHFGFLAIGDEALNFRNHPDYPYTLDLGKAWQEWTGCPFVFGVWVVNKDSFYKFNEEITDACKKLLCSKKWGCKKIEFFCEIIEHVTLNKEELLLYFNHLVYDLGPREKKGLTIFYSLLYETGEIKHIPVLEFFPLHMG